VRACSIYILLRVYLIWVTLLWFVCAAFGSLFDLFGVRCIFSEDLGMHWMGGVRQSLRVFGQAWLLLLLGFCFCCCFQYNAQSIKEQNFVVVVP
jgi:hypothetical protein